MHRPLIHFRVLLAALALGVLGGCIWATDEPYLADQNPPPLELVSTDPSTGTDGLFTDDRVVFIFDAPVHPDAVNRDTVWLTASSADVAASRRVHLLDCAVILRPHVPLAPLLTHQAQVEGVYGFTAGPLGSPHGVVFTTGDGTGASPPPAPPSLESVFATVFAPRCAACHTGAYAPAGLDLSSEDAAAQGLIHRESPLRPGSTLVVPGRHGSSYLMWKLLGLPARFGDAMPPAGDWPTDRGCANTDADLRLVADWIDGL